MLVPGLNTDHHAFFPYSEYIIDAVVPYLAHIQNEEKTHGQPNRRPIQTKMQRKKNYEPRPSESWFPSDGALTIKLQRLAVSLRTTRFNMQKLYTVLALCSVFCTDLRTNSDLCHLQHKLIGFYNRDEKCLQRGTDWVFK